MLALGVTWRHWYARIGRGQTHQTKQFAFVGAAQALGASKAYNQCAAYSANILAPVIVQVSLDVWYVVLTAAALSSVGLGADGFEWAGSYAYRLVDRGVPGDRRFAGDGAARLSRSADQTYQSRKQRMKGDRVSESMLLTPIAVGGLTLRNRIALAPMDTELTRADGSVTDRYVAFLRERARGGAGLIFTEFSAVDEAQMMSSLGCYSGRLKAGLNQLVEAVAPFGSRILLQLAHHGGQALIAMTGRRPVAPSEIECPLYTDPPRALTEQEIEELIQRFAHAALRAKDAGLHGVEVHGAYNYLIGEFLSPAFNRRDDRFGGTFENRMRFAGAIIARIRELCGSDFPFGFKFNVYEDLQGGISVDEGIRIASWAESQGAAYVHVAIMASRIDLTHLSTLYSSSAQHEELSRRVKDAVGVPVIATACARVPADAERILQEGKADIVAIGRGFLADPAWGLKSGTPEQLRPCILCNRCHQRIMTSRTVHCTVNPHLGEDEGIPPGKAVAPRNVAIVGAGPAGISASLAAAERGHHVRLYESSTRLGGNLVHAARHSFKQPMRELLAFFERSVEESDVGLVLDCRPSPEEVAGECPDVILVATGSHPIVPVVPGVERDIVHLPTSQEVLDGTLPHSVVVVGAGLVGLETALHLTEKGCAVTVVDMMSEEQALSGEGTYVLQNLWERLEKGGVQLEFGLELVEIDSEGVICRGAGSKTVYRACEGVVLALGYAPDLESLPLFRAGCSTCEIFAVGDCHEVGNLYDAIRRGHLFGSLV